MPPLIDIQLHIEVIGYLLVGLSAGHLFFPTYFKWARELKNLQLINRQMMYVHTFFIGLTVLLMGMLCLTAAKDLTENPFGRKISLGLGIFWTWRLIFQFFVYSAELWKGKKFETVVHVLFSFLWFYLSAVFLYTALAVR